MKKFKENIRAIGSIGMVAITSIVYLLFSFISIKDGLKLEDALKYTPMNWVMLAISVTIPTVMGLMINSGLRGYAYDLFLKDPEVEKIKKEILELTSIEKGEKQYDSIETFIKKRTIRDGWSKPIFGVLTAIFTIDNILTTNFGQILGAVVTIIMWLAFGVSAMLKTIEYGQEDGKKFLVQELKRLKEKEEASKYLALPYNDNKVI